MPEELVEARAQQRRGLASYLKSVGNYGDGLRALSDEGENESRKIERLGRHLP